ncbi:chloride channel CLIC-like protein 1 isoform X3 [Paramisgurnus dabryanus]|uniref:chloride channel CLIC-like protein 1 isoform X3 n=1 Tax=Paramisgurnus dabryanus TaxID=90735 RepID=UPI0031F37236
MNVSSSSSTVFCSLIVFCVTLLFVIAYANGNNDDEWIDPYDMLNYDPTAKRMRKPTEPASYDNVPTKRREFNSDSRDPSQFPDVSECLNKLEMLQKEVDEHKKKGGVSQHPTCYPVFKRFLSKLLKEAARLGLPNDAHTVMHYDTEVKLSKQTVSEFNKLLKEDNDWTTGAMDDALSQVLMKFKHHNPEKWKWRFEDTFYVEVDTVLKILSCVLVVTAVICTEMWSMVSWFIQFKRMFAVCFFISLIWNWFHLYMLAFAEHQKNTVKVENFNEKCTGLKQMDWKDSLSEWYRRTWTLQDDPCKQYYEVLLVNPILLVPPTKAITVTITNFITDPLKHIGQGISEFLIALLKDLPVTLQIPVLLLIGAAILLFVYGSAHAAIQHALPWPRLGGRHDPPPPAVAHQPAPQLREHGHWAGGDAPLPLQLPQEGNRINQAGNLVNQGFRGRNANADMYTVQPRERDDQSSMVLRHRFNARPGEAQTVRVENLRFVGSASGEDNIDFQQGTQEPGPEIEGVGEPKVKEVLKEEEKENSASSKDKEQKDAQTQDKSENEPISNEPSQQIDVKTLGAEQGNDGASGDTTEVLGEEKCSSFRTPVQETQP